VLLELGADVRRMPISVRIALMGHLMPVTAWYRNGTAHRLLKCRSEEPTKADHAERSATTLIRDAADEAGFDFVGFVEGGDIAAMRGCDRQRRIYVNRDPRLASTATRRQSTPSVQKLVWSRGGFVVGLQLAGAASAKPLTRET